MLSDKSGVDLSGVKFGINPFCEIALEEALRFKEKNWIESVIAVTIGPESAQSVLRTALALGADKAIHINTQLSTD